jgi:hypothetical protein
MTYRREHKFLEILLEVSKKKRLQQHVDYESNYLLLVLLQTARDIFTTNYYIIPKADLNEQS